MFRTLSRFLFFKGTKVPVTIKVSGRFHLYGETTSFVTDKRICTDTSMVDFQRNESSCHPSSNQDVLRIPPKPTLKQIIFISETWFCKVFVVLSSIIDTSRRPQ